VKVDPKLGDQWKVPLFGGQWKVPMLGGQWKVPMLGGQWKVPSLVANGMFQAWWPMKGEGKTPFHLFPLSPQQTYLNLQFFPLTLRFYFSMVLGRYSCLFFLFFNL